jgi:hypothetical protein
MRNSLHAAKTSYQGAMLVSMDQDLGKIQVEFRAQRTLLLALSVTQSEHTTFLREHTVLLKEHSAILKEHGTQLSSLTAKVDLVQAGIGLIHEKLDLLLNR